MSFYVLAQNYLPILSQSRAIRVQRFGFLCISRMLRLIIFMSLVMALLNYLKRIGIIIKRVQAKPIRKITSTH